MNAPELTSIRISMNQDGTYDIPFFQAKNISKEQVEEYKEDALMYAELGLSQFIPFIPRITDELRMGGVTTSIDGQMGTMEQQQILKYLYRLLFGKEITSTNLADVKRAFFTSL